MSLFADTSSLYATMVRTESQHLQCRRIFVLSRFEDKSYSEIAEELSISVNTVKTQIGRAVERLRFELKDYLIMDAILFYSFVYSSAFDKIIHAVA